jgi:hypothetical protein
MHEVLKAFPWRVLAGAALAGAILLAARLIGPRRLARAAGATIEGLRRFAVSAGALGRALSPVVVPLVAIAAYASVYYAHWIQLVAGAASAALLWFLWFSEGRIGHDRAEADRLVGKAEQKVAAVAQRGMSAAATPLHNPRLAETISVDLALGTRQRWIARAAGVVVTAGALGLATVVWGSRPAILLGILGFLVVAVARLYGYATSLVRWGIVVVLALLCVRIGVFAGFLPGETTLFGSGGPRVLPSFVIPLVALAALLVGEAVLLHGADAPPPSPWKRHFRAIGFVLAFAAAGAFAIGMLDARVQTTSGTTAVHGAYQAIKPVALAEDISGDDRQLAWTYAPVLRLKADEAFLPSSAGDYLGHAKRVPCKPGAVGGCTKLECLDCADRGYSQDAASHEHGIVFYARVAHTDELQAWPNGELYALVQYWIFYDYDLWRAHTAAGDLIQEHDADWEFVAVGLRSPREPLFVALSAHCGGQLVPWNQQLAVLEGTTVDGRVQITPPDPDLPDNATSIRATHPIVAVALGSHGNYADNSGQRPPDWGSCMHVPGQALGPLVYAANVRDDTASADDNARLAQAKTVEVVTATMPPMDVAGKWGTETIRFRHRTWPGRPGPGSPPAQRRSWAGAIRTFLCDRYWTRDSMFQGDIYRAACAPPTAGT